LKPKIQNSQPACFLAFLWFAVFSDYFNSTFPVVSINSAGTLIRKQSLNDLRDRYFAVSTFILQPAFTLSAVVCAECGQDYGLAVERIKEKRQGPRTSGVYLKSSPSPGKICLDKQIGLR
jgi:hypothetical protein